MKEKSAKFVSIILIIVVTFTMSSCSARTTESYSSALSNLFGKSEYEKVYDTYADKMEEAAKRIKEKCIEAKKEITDEDELCYFAAKECLEITALCFEGKETMSDIDDESRFPNAEYEKWSKKLDDKETEYILEVANVFC